MQYKYDDYDYYTEHQYNIEDRQQVLEEIAKEELPIDYKECA